MQDVASALLVAVAFWKSKFTDRQACQDYLSQRPAERAQFGAVRLFLDRYLPLTEAQVDVVLALRQAERLQFATGKYGARGLAHEAASEREQEMRQHDLSVIENKWAELRTAYQALVPLVM